MKQFYKSTREILFLNLLSVSVVIGLLFLVEAVKYVFNNLGDLLKESVISPLDLMLNVIPLLIMLVLMLVLWTFLLLLTFGLYDGDYERLNGNEQFFFFFGDCFAYLVYWLVVAFLLDLCTIMLSGFQMGFIVVHIFVILCMKLTGCSGLAKSGC